MPMSAPKVELLYAGDCPNASEARAQLLRAFVSAGLQPHWREWRTDDPSCPAGLRGLGSPTILVAGRDVAGAGKAADASCCRVYAQESGKLSGVPSVAQIAGALKHGGASRWSMAALGGPALAVAFLPKLVCPACWPAYAAAATALGLSFLLEVRYLLPLTVAALGLAVLALAWNSRARRGFGPAVLALAASAIIVSGKFALDSTLILYSGAAAFLAAFVWNAWPRRDTACQPHCPACAKPADGPGDSSTAQPGDTHER